MFTVSGEANFAMSSTRLTVGGFTQPGVARNLIDIVRRDYHIDSCGCFHIPYMVNLLLYQKWTNLSVTILASCVLKVCITTTVRVL